MSDANDGTKNIMMVLKAFATQDHPKLRYAPASSPSSCFVSDPPFLACLGPFIGTQSFFSLTTSFRFLMCFRSRSPRAKRNLRATNCVPALFLTNVTKHALSCIAPCKFNTSLLDGMLPRGNGFTNLFHTCCLQFKFLRSFQCLSYWGRRAQIELKPY